MDGEGGANGLFHIDPPAANPPAVEVEEEKDDEVEEEEDVLEEVGLRHSSTAC